MSRAFVNEDNLVEDVPERSVSSHTNYVTSSGMAAIDAALESAQRALSDAQARADRDILARASRDLRYWNARRATAELIPDVSANDVVQFGSTVTFVRDDGRRQTFRIVGEDEADPSRGMVSWISPLAKALLGRREGDFVRVGSAEATIARIA